VNASKEGQIELLREQGKFSQLFHLDNVGELIAEFNLHTYPAYIDTREGVIAQ